VGHRAGPDVTRSVVVVSLEGGAWLEECLVSVHDQTDQLVVVDNGSADAQVSAVGHRFGATVVRSRVNRGFTGGANEGVRAATGEVVALLNDDAVAEPNWLAAAEEALSKRSVAAITPKVLLHGWFGQVLLPDETWYAPSDARPLGRQLTSIHYDGEELLERLVGPGVHGLEKHVDAGRQTRWRWSRPGKPFYVPLTSSARPGPITVNGNEEVTCNVVCRLVNNAGLFLRPDGYAGDHGLESPDDGRWDRPRETFGVSGTAMVTRAATLRRVGLFADPFFAYYEDADWSWRARRQGFDLTYVPSTSVSHRRSVTSGPTLGARIRILGERNRLLCMVRNAPRPDTFGEIQRTIAAGPDHGVRRGLIGRLPWALATRTQLERRSTVSRTEVWDRWAGADVEWDDRPSAPEGGAGG
jgi:GT2 family glycosyltransferase